ncbi:MAG: hypothetical protein KC652_09630 [Cyanobacteria bacterium HKST-UBA01]|nr:hypothetical protein [Cyanobacteria bacterium HKST-UBA01]
MAVFPAILDSSVLFNRPVTDTLLRAAEYGLYRVHWTQRILDETTGSLIKRSKMNRAQASHLQEELAKAFPEAMHPDVFLSDLFDLDSRLLERIIREQCKDLTGLSAEDLLAKLETHVPNFVSLIR